MGFKFELFVSRYFRLFLKENLKCGHLLQIFNWPALLPWVLALAAVHPVEVRTDQETVVLPLGKRIQRLAKMPMKHTLYMSIVIEHFLSIFFYR